ncbi:MAG: hypothetical protein GY754_31120 [bacterium]|nr:hypothetical protein [bacterium]
MNSVKKIIKITNDSDKDKEGSKNFWLSKTPEERVEAVETIREQYYSMLGYDEPPRIKKIIKFS